MKSLIAKMNKIIKKTESIVLFAKIVELAEKDNEYSEKLNLWLTGKKGTVFLRDSIVRVFDNGSLDFFNAWVGLDSCILKLKRG